MQLLMLCCQSTSALGKTQEWASVIGGLRRDNISAMTFRIGTHPCPSGRLLCNPKFGVNNNVKCFGEFDTCLAIFDARSSTCTV